jgi:hypothetical protein
LRTDVGNFFVPVGAVLLKLEEHSRNAFGEVRGKIAAMGLPK